MAILATLILLGCAAGLVACWFRAKKNPEGMKVAVAALLALAAFAVVLKACSATRNRGRVLGANYYAATGYLLGRQVAERVPDGGDVLVLQYNFTEEPAPAGLAQIAGVKAAFEKTRLKIGAVEPAFDPNTNPYPEELTLVAADLGAPETIFFDSIAKHPDAVAVISFIGAPIQVRTGRPARPRDNLPPLFILNPGLDTPWLAWLKRGFVKAVLLPKPGTEHSGMRQIEGKTRQQIAETHCLLVTRDNVADVLSQLQKNTVY